MSAPTFHNLSLSTGGAVATLVISRPEALNVLNSETLDELRRAIAHLAADESVRGVILTGAGQRVFVAGADIREMSAFSPLQAHDFSQKIKAVFRGIERIGKPVVAGINGVALGGGCELAMACHFRIAVRAARIGLPEVKLGLIAGGGGTLRLERLVGRSRALEMLLTGEPVGAEEALSLGLVNRVVEPEDLLPQCLRLLERILGNAPLAVRYSLQAVCCGSELPAGEAEFLESTLFAECFASEDMKEGMGAFLEKRKPDFRGR